MRKLTTKTYLVPIIFWSLISCHSTSYETNLYSNLKIAMERMEIDNMISENQTVMLINMKGCSVCYSRALYFLEKNSDSKNISYIITGVQSKKNLEIRLGKSTISKDNIFLDLKDIIYSSGIHETYPIIFYRQSSKLLKIELADLNNSGVYETLSGFINESAR